MRLLGRAHRPRRGQTINLSVAAARGDLRLALDDPAVRARLVAGGHLPNRRRRGVVDAAKQLLREAIDPPERSH